MNENDSGEKKIISLKDRAMAKQRSGRETVELLALEISNLRESCQNLREGCRILPEALATEIMERIQPLEEIRERLDEITEAQRASIKELMEEIAIQATQGMEQITDEVKDGLQKEVSRAVKASNVIKASAQTSLKVGRSMNKLTPRIESLIEQLDKAADKKVSSHIQTAVITGLITAAAMIAYFTLP